MMNPITQRITTHLFKHIHARTVLDLYQRASDVGLLAVSFVQGERKLGVAWHVSANAAPVLAGDPGRTRHLIERALKRAPKMAHGGFVDDDDGEPGSEVTVTRSSNGLHLQHWADDGNAGAKSSTRKKRQSTSANPAIATVQDSRAMFVLLREFLPPPNPMQVTVALLIARAVGESVADLGQLRDVLTGRSPVVLLKIPVGGFEQQFGLMLEEGLIAPFFAELTDIFGDRPVSGHYRKPRSETRTRKVITCSGRKIAGVTTRNLKRYLSTAMLADPVPLVIADETLGAPQPEIIAAADIVLECAGIDQALVAELLHVCLQIPASESLSLMETMAFDPARLRVEDFALAVRPGRTAKAVLSLLVNLAEAADDDENDDDDNRSKTGRSSNPMSAFRSKAKASPIDMIQPEAEPKAELATDAAAINNPKAVIPGAAAEATSSTTQHVRSLRVEHLSGYGEARPWALHLKEDLVLWREGELGWDEMSTKMLLSGPPGTGKTTFAKALCNTLQVPLIVSSVASWLEPGYLGDVLQRMSAVFETAREHAPCIVFIDEMDAIGSRGGGQGRGARDDTYWTTVVTRLLEMLDGAMKTEGVIVVGATNLPDRIDPALLRSGRLEKHVIIPAPDAEALAGILAHHLGSDLAAVLATAPKRGEQPEETTPPNTSVPAPNRPKSTRADTSTIKGQIHV